MADSTSNLGLSLIDSTESFAPDTLNDNFDIIDSTLGVDYVTGYGHGDTVNDWFWREWASGIFECWCYVYTTANSTDTSGSLKVSTPDYPKALGRPSAKVGTAGEPHAFVSLGVTGNNYARCDMVYATTTYAYAYMRWSSGVYQGCYTHFYVVGRVA